MAIMVLIQLHLRITIVEPQIIISNPAVAMLQIKSKAHTYRKNIDVIHPFHLLAATLIDYYNNFRLNGIQNLNKKDTRPFCGNFTKYSFQWMANTSNNSLFYLVCTIWYKCDTNSLTLPLRHCIALLDAVLVIGERVFKMCQVPFTLCFNI